MVRQVVSGAIAVSFAISVGLLILLFGVRSFQTLPPNATVVVHHIHNTYASPPCIINRNVEHDYAVLKTDNRGRLLDLELLPETTTVSVEDARTRGAKPDRICSNASGFMGEMTSLAASLFGWDRPRWTEDGDWLW